MFWKILFILAVAAEFVTVPLFLIFLGGTIPFSGPILSIFAVLSTALGYGLQWGFAKLTGKTASLDGYDDPTRGVLGKFRFSYAFVPMLTALLLSVGVFFLYNVIVMRIGLEWTDDYPYYVSQMRGSGPAEIFQSGRYIQGSWVHATRPGRLIFLDENGQELTFQRGKSYIVLGDQRVVVSYQP